jgi:adenylate kinase family enzyme
MRGRRARRCDSGRVRSHRANHIFACALAVVRYIPVVHPTAPPPQRGLVVGPPGVGKTWVARRLASAYVVPHVELDGFRLKPNRQLAAPDEFRASLEGAVENERWLLDGNWSDDDLAESVWRQVDLVVWLDYPRHVVMRQVVLRTLRRLVRREAYYGWTERIRDLLSPTHPVRWSWKTVAVYSDRYGAMNGPACP